MTKLKNILSEVFDEQPQVNKHEVIEGVKNYGKVGQSLFNNNNIMEIAEELSKVAESAHTHILGEQGDWFDKVSVNKNMNYLKGSVKEFKKTATEAHSLNQRLQGLYEDIGNVLGRYYDIDEHVMQEDTGKDWDKDGIDEPDSEEYLDLKDKAIKANMGESGDIEEGLPAHIIAKLPMKPPHSSLQNWLDNMRNQDDKTYIKDFPLGSEERAAEYAKRNWAPDETLPADPEIIQQYGESMYSDIDEAVNTYQESLNKESENNVEESADAKLLRLAGITKESVAAAKPTKRLADIKGAGIVTHQAVGKITKKW
tara:strand:- start:353 stop:1288 length:936 start_codon:yes stop_codon:yes gene_type:complete